MVDGWAITQGDIVLGTAEAMEARKHQTRLADKEAGRGKSLIRSDEDFLWPDKTMPYTVDPDFSEPEQEKIFEAIDHWQGNSDIDFAERTDEEDFVTFVEPSSGCSSFVGRLGGEQFIRLAPGCSIGNTIHEIGHALGLWHEQQRSDRDDFVTPLRENLDKRAALVTFGPAAPFGEDSGDYDQGSIMHYGPFFFTNETGKPTLETIPPGLQIGQRDALSAGDLDGVARLYDEPPARTVITTNPTGLEFTVDGVTSSSRRTLNWAPGSVHEISAPTQQGDGDTRYLFGRWSDGGEQTHMVTASPDRTVYTANFIVQHRIETDVDPPGSGTVTIDPPAADNFYTLRSPVEVGAVPNTGFFFVEWFGFGFFRVHGLSGNPAAFLNSAPGASYTASFSDRPPTIVGTNHPGAILLFDDDFGPAPIGQVLEPGTTHTIGAPPVPVPVGPSGAVRRVFREWSDGGARVHDFTASAEGGEINARFDTQFLLSTSVFPSGAGDIFASPQTLDGFYDDGTHVIVAASTNEDFTFAGWLGDLIGLFDSTQQLKMDEQRDVIGVYSRSTMLTSGVPGRFNLFPVEFASLFLGSDLVYSIEVPPGATELEVLVGLDVARFDVAIFLRRGFRPRVSQGRVIADHSSRGIGASQSVLVRPSSDPPLRPGTYFIGLATFTLDANVNGTITATVTGGDPQPEVGLSAEALTFASPEGEDPPPQTIQIRNTGADTLSFLANTDQPWLHVAPNEGTSAGEDTEITISVDNSFLPPGAYEGNVSILRVDELANGADLAKVAPLLIPVTLVVIVPAPMINAGGVVNAASGGATVVPGGIASIFGIDLSGDTLLAEATPLPTELGGVRVTVNGIEAPIFFVSPLQINFQIPFGVPTDGTLTIVVTRDGMASPPEEVPVALYAPGVFVNFLTGEPIIQRFPDFSLITSENPAQPNDVLIIYFTGVGGLSNPPATGSPATADPLSQTLLLPTVTVGGTPVNVLFAGLAPFFIGTGQGNIALPAVLPAPSMGPSGSTLTLIISFDGAASIPVELPVE